jgi:hypothetical protein
LLSHPEVTVASRFPRTCRELLALAAEERVVRPPCRSHLSPVGSPYVDTLDDAVFVVDASVGGVPSFGCVALLLDGDDRLLTAVECVACDTPARVVEFCGVLLAASSSAGAWRRLVVASSFDDRETCVGDRVFEEAWPELVATCAGSPVELVDWLLVDLPAGVVDSLREAMEGRFPW